MKRKAERVVWKNIRLTPAEDAKIKQSAESAGVTSTEWMRSAALGHHVQSHVDMVALNELRRQGGLLKHLHNEGVLDSAASWSALQALEAAAARLMGG